MLFEAHVQEHQLQIGLPPGVTPEQQAAQAALGNLDPGMMMPGGGAPPGGPPGPGPGAPPEGAPPPPGPQGPQSAPPLE